MSDNGITFFLPSILLVDVIDDWNGCESGGGRTLYTLYHRCIAMECRTDAQFEFYMHNNLVNTGYAKKIFMESVYVGVENLMIVC